VPRQGPAGFQYARTGTAYAGLWMLNGYGGNYREYLQVQLIDTLEFSECYLVSFFVNLHNFPKYAVNNFGMFISDNSFTTSGPSVFIPQIVNFKNEIIGDTLNWTEVSGIYVANGMERFITIGNFSNDANTDTLNTGNGTYSGAYYYIDDVSLIPIDSIPLGIPAFAGNDTSMIIGDSVFIGQEISNLNCNWYNSTGNLIASNISGIYVRPTSTTYYVVEQNLCGSITYDTVNVIVQPLGTNDIKSGSETIIFPNPSSGLIYISSKDFSPVDLIITDITGKPVFSKLDFKLNEGSTELNLNLENGIYFIQLRNKTKNEDFFKKVIINK
jgi:hypothetical protein